MSEVNCEHRFSDVFKNKEGHHYKICMRCGVNVTMPMGVIKEKPE